MTKLRDYIFAVCTLLLCFGLQFSGSASAKCHDMEPSIAQATGDTYQAIALTSSASLEHAINMTAMLIQSAPEEHRPESHDCCDGDMSQCSMAQCVGVLYASTSTPSTNSTRRPTTHFQPLRAGAPKHPSSTLFRPPILS